MDGAQGGVLERLSRWDERLAALDGDMGQSIEALEAVAVQFPPIPRALPLDDVPDLIPSISNLDIGSSPMAKELEATQLVTWNNDESLVTRQLHSVEDFLVWMRDEVEPMMVLDDDAHLKTFQGFLNKRGQECDDVISNVQSSLDHLSRLLNEYQRVSDETNQLHTACEQLLSDQGQLSNLVEVLDNKLSYFTEWERIAPRLENDSVLTVTSESFVPTLARIDECLAYLKANPQYKESAVYLAKFQSSLTRALTLIRSYVVSSLEAATNQVVAATKAQADENGAGPSTTNAFTLFYGRFRTRAPRIKALMEQLELRQNVNEPNSEYATLLSDCHQCYIAQRQTLLAPSVSESIRLLSEKHSRDHCTLVRSGCAFLIHMCQDEYQLFYNFFAVKPPLFDAFLESLCLTLYDLLRPLIIHINHLETLAELCSILKVEMMEGPNETLISSSSSVSGLSDIHSISGSSSIYGSGGVIAGLRPFSTIARQLLEDVQERLVYRAHVYAQSDILGFNPSPGDLAYPEKLKMMRDIANSIQSGGEEGSTRSIFSRTGKNASTSPADLHGMWYPTVRRTLVTLSKLYRCVDKSIFQGLSQELLTACIKSLVTASLEISARKEQFDGRLFLIKHLLIIREQIAPFQVDFSVKETSLDFSSVRTAAVSLYKSRSNIFHLGSNNALLKFLLDGTPQVKEQMIDSRKDVDWQLKKTCEEFIHLAVSGLVTPLKNFLDKASYLVATRKTAQRDLARSSITNEISTVGQEKPLRLQPFATPEKLHDVVGETNKLLRSKLPKLLKAMSLYLANKDTESILFKPVKVGIQEAYRDLRKILDDHYRGSLKKSSGSMIGPVPGPTDQSEEDPDEDLKIVACPEAEQLNLLLTSIISSIDQSEETSTKPKEEVVESHVSN